MTAHNVYTQSASEANIQAAICEYLRFNGWMVVETSQRNRITGGLVGLPDVICFKHGITWLIECKTEKGKLRKSQLAFYGEVEQHLGDTLWYLQAHSVDDAIKMNVEIQEWMWGVKQ